MTDEPRGGGGRASDDLDAAVGFIEPRLHAEFPGLALRWLSIEGRLRPSSPALARHLRTLADRYRGGRVVAMRTQPIPHAYRAFYRQIGLDPDVTRIPSEQIALSRLMHGGFESRNCLYDARLVAAVETGVPVWALDADLVDAGGLGIRASRAGERLGSGAESFELPAGRLVVADSQRLHGLLFGEVAPGHAPGPATRRVVLYTLGVSGVPAIHLEEALWICKETMNSG